jgi:predicted TPR repeat methyltransferase
MARGRAKTSANNPPGDLPARIAALECCHAQAPDDDAVRYALGQAWLEAGECARAVDILRRIGKRSPLAEEAASAIAKAQTIASAPRAPAAYVRHLFDQFSERYDSTMLDELSYRAPQILRSLADLVQPKRRSRIAILDLGCGTGLAAEAFKDVARRIDGVDLSPAMIAKARERGLYAALETADLETALNRKGPAYDLILAADTLVYLGDLEPVFRGAAHRLKASGFFLFTVEAAAEKDYELGEKRRFRHSAAYLRKLAKIAGLEIMGLLECSPRMDSGYPVEGLAVALQRLAVRRRGH